MYVASVNGIDIGGAKPEIGHVYKDGHFLKYTDFRTKEYPNLGAYLNTVVRIIDLLKRPV